jgi:ribose transport system ATP-binding protein
VAERRRESRAADSRRRGVPLTTDHALRADQPLIEIEHVSKTFPGLRALTDVQLAVRSKEIVALVGENGSGKSTLAKILAGVYEPDAGSAIRIDGLDRAESGGDRLHFIHQDLALIPILSTIENLDLARKLGRKGLRPFHRHAERRHARERVALFGASFDVDAPVESLSPAERAIVAITRALDGWTRPDNVLVLDEPTEALHGEEVGKLFRAVREIAQRGAGVIFISHRLGEVIDLAHRVVVLRDGRVVGQLDRGNYDKTMLTELIVGKQLLETAPTHEPTERDAVFELAAVAGPGLQRFDVRVRPGEIVGVTGVLGSGREFVCGTAFGAIKRTSGEVRVNGEELKSGSPLEAIRRGVAYVPAERKSAGAVMDMSARENLTLPDMPVKHHLRLDRRADHDTTATWMEKVDLRPRRPEQPLRLFSGGNQQKIVLAKWLRTDPRVLLLDEPTQGVDVGAKATIYELINLAAKGGAGVLISSADARELTVLCDRVIVVRDGCVALELEGNEISEARLLRESITDRQFAVAQGEAHYV